MALALMSRGSTSEGWKNVVPKEQQEDPLHAFGINLFKLCFNVGGFCWGRKIS